MSFLYSDVAADRKVVLKALGVADLAARTNVLAFLGDSITADMNYAISANAFAYTVSGFGAWVRILTRQRFYCPPANNFGVSGNTTSQMVARLPDVLAAAPNFCVVHAGTNDIPSGSADTAIANLTIIYDSLKDIGCTVIAVPILGRSGAAALTSAGRARGHKINAWIRRQADARENFYVADCGLVFDDLASTAWAEKSGYTPDGIHPNAIGGLPIAQRVALILNTLYPDWLIPVANQNDLYDATDNLSGNLCGNGLFVGGSTVATGWSSDTSQMSGGVATLSKSTMSDGRPAQQIDFSGSYTAGSNRQYVLSYPLPFGSMATGDQLESWCEVEASGLVGVASASIIQYTTESGVLKSVRDGYNRDFTISLPGTWSGIMRTPRRTLEANPTSSTLELRVHFLSPAAGSQAIAGMIKLASAATRKVV